jgi:hypothetical protein
MDLSALQPNFTSVVVLGFGGTLLGVAALFLGAWRRWGRASAAAALALAAAGAAAAAARLAQPFWLPPLALAAVWGLFLLARGPAPAWLGRRALWLVGRPRLQWGLLLLASPLLMVWETRRQAEGGAELFEPPPGMMDPLAVGLHEVDGAYAVTDAGTELSVFAPNLPKEGAALIDEQGFLSRQRLKLGVLHVAPQTPDYNCHGWVFLGGRHWLCDDQVDQVLEDNNYQPVAQPRPGDVAVYRDGEGEVVHSGVVRTASDGLVLIESKWGGLGRYLHTPSDHVYGDAKLTYYRSPRTGHLLTLHEAAPPSSAPGPAKPNLLGG